MKYTSVAEYICHYAETIPDVPAVIAGDVNITYGDLWRLVRGFAYYLRHEAKVKKGDIVLAKVSQTANNMILYFGTLASGCIFAPVESNSSGESFHRIIRELGPKLIVTDPNDDLLEDQTRKIISSRDILAIAGQHADDAEKEKFIFPAKNETALIMFTTGTTGVSKGVEHTQWSMLAPALNMAAAFEMKQGTHFLIPGPMNHAGPLRKSIMTIITGSTIVVLNGMKSMRAVFDAIEKAPGVVGCAFVPSMLRIILKLTGNKLGEYTDKIDFIITDGAVFSETERQNLCKLLPKTRLYTSYGASEFGNATAYDYSRFPGKRNCVGTSLTYSKVFVLDKNKQIMTDSSPENTGLLACIGNVNMKCYWNAPELTATVMFDGMVCSNDEGYIDKDGYVYFLGRQGDVINVGGLKVAPTEVEVTAAEYPSIQDCVCIPVDDEVSGMAAKLCVVCKAGEALDTRKLRSFLMEHLENYKIPKYIVEVDDIPKTYNGKLNRKEAIVAFNTMN